MSPCVSKSLCFSSTLKIEEEEVMVTKKQGIVSILGTCDSSNQKAASSLRRTLSADMSSKKWLTQHGFNSSPMKKTASSEELIPVSITQYSSSSSDAEEETDTETNNTPTQFDIWSSIQQEKNNNNSSNDDQEKAGQFDMWSSILSQKAQEDPKSLPPPYIHPLVRRSASSLSEKSLEICTESLGSETGSDGFSSYPPSETGDVEEDKEEEQEVQQQQQRDEKVAVKNTFDGEDFQAVKYNYVKKAMPQQQKSFPPPISSLSRGDGAASLRMKSHRDNGRLVLEAVPVPQQNNNFKAQREGGRLVLTFASKSEGVEQKPTETEEEKYEEKDEFEEEFDCFVKDSQSEEEEEEEEETEEAEEVLESLLENGSRDNKEMGCYVIEQAPTNLTSGLINVHRLALMGLPNRNPTWSNKFNETAVKFVEEEQVEVKSTPIAQSLPPRPPRLIPSPPSSAAAAKVAAAAAAATAASFNAYEYYWRPKPMAEQSLPLKNSNNKLILSRSSPMADEKQEMVILRGNKGDYLVPLLKGCKEPRRSLLFWEPYCIATS